MPLAAALASILALSTAATSAVGPDSGLPVPRFESLKSSEANGRRGPDFAQPALYRYVRQGLPLQVVGESGPWRRVRDPDGAESWMHKDLIGPRKTALVKRSQSGAPVALLSSPRPNARMVAKLQAGVVAAVVDCAGPWRRLEVQGRIGWALESHVWGEAGCAN